MQQKASSQKTSTNEEKLATIVAYVKKQRRIYGIRIGDRQSVTISCIGNQIGEMGALVENVLPYRPEHTWNEFTNDQEMLDGAYRYVSGQSPKKPKRSR